MIQTRLYPIVVATHLSTAVALFGIVLVALLSIHHQLKENEISTVTNNKRKGR